MSGVISDPEKYFRGFIPERNEFLKVLESEAQKEQIPIIGPVMGELLYILIRAINAKKVLELGTAIGYSAILMAQALGPQSGRLVTIELSEGLADRARKNFAKAGVEETVTLEKGDCREVMKRLETGFDLIFVDIDKEYYRSVLPACHELLNVNGLLVADNTSFKDVGEFNDAVFRDKRWRSVNLFCHLPMHSPEKDGICIAVKC